MRCPSCGTNLEGDTPVKCPECGCGLPVPGGLWRAVAWVEDAAVSLMLVTMVLLVLVQIVLRNFYSTGITGGAEMVRHMVLWIAFLSAGLAAREGKHIKIDVAYRMLPDSMKGLAGVITSLFTALVCAILVYAAIQFIRVDYASKSMIVFYKTPLPVWVLELIIPIGYLAVMLRFASRSIQSFTTLLRGG